ncbi:hypothetical protein BV25DRAFT_723924 [Artomyces pyxidatus]|uniref:Uncharacterized protein n=1 Tax=Artomyces pyxidatus TaxID=48021 RepID=A0ACB8SZI4_9AGAM|nr:hypothetical protein BV25DRAFT_723924 [Artomyces pyxidatus]
MDTKPSTCFILVGLSDDDHFSKITPEELQFDWQYSYITACVCEVMVAIPERISFLEMLTLIEQDARLRGEVLKMLQDKDWSAIRAIDAFRFVGLGHTPTLGSADANVLISELEGDIDHAITQYLSNAESSSLGPLSLPLWQTPSDIEATAGKSLEDLHIPHVNSVSNPSSVSKPDLLLHRHLANHASNENVSNTSDEVMNTFLVNTTASGETSMLLDALRTRWGFYLTAEPGGSGNQTGSHDLKSLLNGVSAAARYYRPAHDTSNLTSNVSSADSRSYIKTKILRIALPPSNTSRR